MIDFRINRALGVPLEDLDVVVVDDSKPMQTIVRSMLSAARVHRVRTFDQAGEAFRAMAVEPPHLLITDWNLPDIDGLALVRSIRDPRSGVLASVPVILITGHATRNLVERAIASGVHFVLAKPLSPSNVLKRVQAAIQDERRFVLDRARGCYVLEGTETLLAARRRSAADPTVPAAADAVVDAGGRPAAPTEAIVPAPATTASRAPAAPVSARGTSASAPAAPTAPIAAEPAAPSAAAARSAARRRNGFGFDAPLHRRLAETSTGQAPPQAS